MPLRPQQRNRIDGGSVPNSRRLRSLGHSIRSADAGRSIRKPAAPTGTPFPTANAVGVARIAVVRQTLSAPSPFGEETGSAARQDLM